MNHSQPITTSLLALACATLLACGGSVSETTTPPPTTTPAPFATLQGFWRITAGANTTSAVILPTGKVWVVYETPGVTALAQTQLGLNANTYSGTGKHYTLPAGAVQDFNLTGTLPATSAATLVTKVALGTTAASDASWSYDKTYETPATQASVQARWSGKQGAASLTWDIDSAGKLTGTSSTGCSYGGTLTPNAAQVAVLDVALTETCAGTASVWSGIATLNATKSALSLAYTTGAQGGVLLLGR